MESQPSTDEEGQCHVYSFKRRFYPKWLTNERTLLTVNKKAQIHLIVHANIQWNELFLFITFNKTEEYF